MKAIINVMRTKTPQKNGKGRKKKSLTIFSFGEGRGPKNKRGPFCFFPSLLKFFWLRPWLRVLAFNGSPFFQGGGVPHSFPFSLSNLLLPRIIIRVCVVVHLLQLNLEQCLDLVVVPEAIAVQIVKCEKCFRVIAVFVHLKSRLRNVRHRKKW